MRVGAFGTRSQAVQKVLRDLVGVEFEIDGVISFAFVGFGISDRGAENGINADFVIGMAEVALLIGIVYDLRQIFDVAVIPVRAYDGGAVLVFDIFGTFALSML